MDEGFSDHEEYVNHYETQTIDGKLAAGAYLLEATGGGKNAQELILVTESRSRRFPAPIAR